VKLRLAACALALLASGCTTLPEPGATEDWPARRAELQALESWALHGRIAVAAGEDGFSGGFDWSQQCATADIELSGPMGGKLMDIRVEGDESFVAASGGNDVGSDAQQFIDEHLGPGQLLPVREMRYWLVGAPAPGIPHEESLGEDRRLASLAQSGWQVRYDRYQPVGSIALPARMEMTTEGLRLRVAISDWRLSP
jgi:outer membrane lipoprotein LolB